MGSVLFKSIQLQTFSVALRFSTVPARVLLGNRPCPVAAAGNSGKHVAVASLVHVPTPTHP